MTRLDIVNVEVKESLVHFLSSKETVCLVFLKSREKAEYLRELH